MQIFLVSKTILNLVLMDLYTDYSWSRKLIKYFGKLSGVERWLHLVRAAKECRTIDFPPAVLAAPT
jgi:hypothetical protein